jgi:predicted ATPase/DNA-binding winged helix-turn-helix (wHTH) protein
MSRAASAPAANVRFGRFELRPRERRLLVDGAATDLGARALDMLIALAERAGRLVSKDELLNIVWPGLVVEENNLQKQVSTLRKVLGPDVIVTIPGRGYQFVAGASAGDTAAAGRTADPAPAESGPGSNLPQWLPPLYGRAEDLAGTADTVRRHRLVTIVGSGGIGKTRLSQAVAFELRATWPDGAWLVELDALSDPALVAGTVGRALGIQVAADPVRAEDVARALERRELLVVIDNCEHLLAAAADLIGALLAGAPHVRVLATSREPLRLPGEVVVRLPPLAVPGPTAHGRALEFGAVELFVNRAHEGDSRFALTEANVGQVIELCGRLDGIALAIELAAARVQLLGLDGVVSRLDQRFRMLTNTGRDVLARQQTLAAIFDWSYELLSPPQRAVFNRLGVFAGSFALSSAQQVATADGIDEWAVLDHLGALVDKSLVAVETLVPEPRYRLLECGREYALQRLGGSGDEAAARRRHARVMIDRIGGADRALMSGSPPLPRFTPLEPDLNNLRSALRWAAGPAGDTAMAIELAARALWLWRIAGVGSEGLRWCAALGDRVGPSVPAPIAARFWLTVGMADHTGWYPDNAQALPKAVQLYRDVGDPIGLFWALIKCALAMCNGGHQAEGEAMIAEAARIGDPAWPPLLWAHFQNACAIIENIAGRAQQSRSHMVQHVELSRRAGDEYGEIIGLLNLADFAYTIGAIDEAVARGRELVVRARASGREWMADSGFINLGAALAESGEFAEAEQMFAEGLRLLARTANARRWTLDHLALLAARSGRSHDAVRIAAFLDQAMAREGAVRGPAETRSRERTAALARAALDADTGARLAAEGAQLTEEAAFTLALPSADRDR